MQITKEWLQEKKACKEGIKWFAAQVENDGVKIVKKLMKENQLQWANWLIVRIMEYKQQYVSYAIYAAEQVIDNFEKEYPNDKRPREAIEAAKKCIENPTEENKNAAYCAADRAYCAADRADSAYSAAYSAYRADSAAYCAADRAYRAAYSAYRAADSADSAAYSAADSAAYCAAYCAADSAACSAYSAADSAYSAAYRAADKMRIKILNYGLKLLGGDK